MSDFTLSPAVAVSIFVLACVSGVQFRRIWKTDGERWKLWLWGSLAAVGLLIVGFVPLAVS